MLNGNPLNQLLGGCRQVLGEFLISLLLNALYRSWTNCKMSHSPHAPAASAADDRGAPCRVAALSGVQVGLRALGIKRLADPHTREEVAITDNLEVGYAIGGGVAGAVGWQLLWLAAPLYGMLGLVVGFIVIPVVTAMITWRLTLGLVRRRRFVRIAGIYLSGGACPSCSYDLTAQEAAGDGCVVCPECGAAWEAARLRVPAESASDSD